MRQRDLAKLRKKHKDTYKTAEKSFQQKRFSFDGNDKTIPFLIIEPLDLSFDHLQYLLRSPGSFSGDIPAVTIHKRKKIKKAAEI